MCHQICLLIKIEWYASTDILTNVKLKILCFIPHLFEKYTRLNVSHQVVFFRFYEYTSFCVSIPAFCDIMNAKNLKKEFIKTIWFLWVSLLNLQTCIVCTNRCLSCTRDLSVVRDFLSLSPGWITSSIEFENCCSWTYQIQGSEYK